MIKKICPRSKVVLFLLLLQFAQCQKGGLKEVLFAHRDPELYCSGRYRLGNLRFHLPFGDETKLAAAAAFPGRTPNII